MDDRRARTETIEDFAATLRELRNSVGNPPFREMSGRSRAISHTTLHEATKGNRLPSWETTVEFVKACGADPAAYRERWERANLAVRSDPSIRADTSVDPPTGGLAAAATGAAEPHTMHPAVVEPGFRMSQRRWYSSQVRMVTFGPSSDQFKVDETLAADAQLLGRTT